MKSGLKMALESILAYVISSSEARAINKFFFYKIFFTKSFSRGSPGAGGSPGVDLPTGSCRPEDPIRCTCKVGGSPGAKVTGS